MNFSWNEPRKTYWEGALIAIAGLIILINLRDWHAAVSLGVLPGALCLLGSGLGLLLWSGDNRLPQFASMGAVLAAIMMPFLALSGEAMTALFLSIVLVGAYLCGGRVSLYTYPQIEGAPTPPDSLKSAALIAIDEALMAWFKFVARAPRGEQVKRIAAELADWEDYLGRHRLRTKLHKLHPQPPDLLKVESSDKSMYRHSYRHIRYDSGYDPAEDMPGRDRWLSYEKNRTAHAWVLEHPGAARPWLVCIHGYRMGTPLADLKVFDPAYFHHKLGLNVACPVLPLHGPRKRGLLSGEGFLEGDFIDFIHAESQAQWDIRRLLSWIRLVKHAPRVGVYGISLGGYNTALLAGLENDLACAVAGIPVTDIASTYWRHFPAPQLAMLERAGVTQERVHKALAGVSPLSFAPALEAEKLGIFAGNVDSLVWPDHPLNLQQHWGNSRLNWYEGSHLSFANEPAVSGTLVETFAAGGLLD